MEELVRVERVGNKSKKTKLDFYTSSDPNKITLEHPSSKIISDSKREQQKYSPPLRTKARSNSRFGCDDGTEKPHHCSKEVSRKKTIRVQLLDSGSNKDLMFHEIGTTKQFPYSTRQVPKSWHTSNGDFQTKRKGNLQLNCC